MTTPEYKKMGRLAFRVEGTMWNAYYAELNTMKDAVFLGSIGMRFIRNNQWRKDAFMLLMREGVSDILEERFGERPAWPEPGGHPAPEHERGGNA